MPERLGAHSARVAQARLLHAGKGRRASGRFLFEGATLLAEALASDAQLESIFATPAAYEQFAILRTCERRGIPVFLVDERTARKLSDVETPAGILAVAHARVMPLPKLLAGGGIVLVLAGLNDPGNAGTLVRSADAFGASGVVFGAGGVEPYHPKVVRAAMGSIFRVPHAISDPSEFTAAMEDDRWTAVGLEAGAGALGAGSLRPPCALVVGHERRGLGEWAAACDRLASIRMQGRAESLNAAVAGSIALYEASFQAPGDRREPSVKGPVKTV